jgi:hypothetical protein
MADALHVLQLPDPAALDAVAVGDIPAAIGVLAPDMAVAQVVAMG